MTDRYFFVLASVNPWPFIGASDYCNDEGRGGKELRQLHPLRGNRFLLFRYSYIGFDVLSLALDLFYLALDLSIWIHPRP